MATNFVGYMSLTPDFGNIVANSDSGSFRFLNSSSSIIVNTSFLGVNFSALSRDQLWFSLPNVFPCTLNTIDAALSIFCDFNVARTNSLIAISKVNSFGNGNYSAWVPFFNYNVVGNSASCNASFSMIADS